MTRKDREYMKILVTGGAGFIGSHLVPLLIEQGHRVTVADNLSTGCREYVPAEAELITLDVRSEALGELMQRESFEAVVHLAAQTQVDISMQNPLLDADENVMGTVNLLETARRNGVKRIILASSAAVYGDVEEGELPLREELVAAPLSFYGLTKLTGENYLRLYQRAFGLDYLCLRFANVYGERQGNGGEGGVISIFAQAAARGGELNIHGDGEQTRDFVYAGDVARGIAAALVTSRVNITCNLSTGTETSVNSLVDYLNEISGRQLLLRHLPGREGDIRRSCLSNERAVKELHWKPQVDISEGLRRTYGYFAERLK